MPNGRHGLLAAGLLGAIAALAAQPAPTVPPAEVSGPVAAPDVPGSPTHDYVFFASDHDLPARGYVEEEFFVKGTAGSYATPDLQTATARDDGHPYLTRIVVRRPADPKRFSGTVVAEWDNVTNFFDAENFWFFGWDGMMRDGDVWVGVSPQTIGVDALKKFSGARYGTLTVGDTVATGSPASLDAPDADAMSYDIFSQVGALLKHPGSIDPLHGLKPKVLIAAGESQSASRLATYVNSIHPLARVYDGFFLLSAIGRKIRPDLVSPVLKMSMEHDVITGDAAVAQPDTPKFRSWDVAGTSHVDQHLRASREPLELRDNGKSLEAGMAPGCAVPTVGTRTPATYVVESGLEKLARWAAGGPPPPSAPHLTVTKVVARPGQSEVARDKDGIAEGGIRLAAVAVPTALNRGLGAPSQASMDAGTRGGEAIGPGACVRWGYTAEWTVQQLDARYPTHAAYVSAVRRVTAENLKDGYILAPDAAATDAAAEASAIGAR